MSILFDPKATVYTLSAPSSWVRTRPGDATFQPYLYWVGGCKWSDRIQDAALFQSEIAAKAHAEAMNLRDWTVCAHSGPQTRPADTITILT